MLLFIISVFFPTAIQNIQLGFEPGEHVERPSAANSASENNISSTMDTSNLINTEPISGSERARNQLNTGTSNPDSRRENVIRAVDNNPRIRPRDTTDAEQYAKMLVYLDEDLVKLDILSMKLLCGDFIPLARLERINRGIDLFAEMEDRGRLKVNHCSLLAELFYHIQRMDLVNVLPEYSTDRVQSEIAQNGTTFSAFRLVETHF